MSELLWNNLWDVETIFIYSVNSTVKETFYFSTKSTAASSNLCYILLTGPIQSEQLPDQSVTLLVTS